jgi:molybdopterin synthase sulfur carrier subunit
MKPTTEVARLLLLGPAREAAGLGNDEIDGDNVADILQEAVRRYGTTFEDVLRVSQIWINGEPADGRTAVGPHDQVAVLPPISGGCN